MKDVEEINFIVINNCVQADLQAIEQNDFEDIIKKLKALPPEKQESVLAILNLNTIRYTLP